MKTPEQMELLSSASKPIRKRQVIYTPIPTDVINKYAYAVCRKYADRHGAEYISTEFVQDFRSFVRVITSAYTRRLNKGVDHALQTI